MIRRRAAPSVRYANPAGFAEGRFAPAGYRCPSEAKGTLKSHERVSRNWQVSQIFSRIQGFWENRSQNLGDDTAKTGLNSMKIKHLPIIQRVLVMVRILIALICLAFVVSCGDERGNSNFANPARKARYASGPLVVGVAISAEEIPLSGFLRIEVSVEYPSGARLSEHGLPPEIKNFALLESVDSRPELLPDGLTRKVHRFVFAPDIPGDYDIPPMRFSLEGSGAPVEVETKRERVVVTSSLQEDATPADIAPDIPVAPSISSRLGVWGAVTALLVLAGAIVAVSFRRRRR